jgi:membrane carboxypeptidase/penicillin-binding protein PbpC
MLFSIGYLVPVCRDKIDALLGSGRLFKIAHLGHVAGTASSRSFGRLGRTPMA